MSKKNKSILALCFVVFSSNAMPGKPAWPASSNDSQSSSSAAVVAPASASSSNLNVVSEEYYRSNYTPLYAVCDKVRVISAKYLKNIEKMNDPNLTESEKSNIQDKPAIELFADAVLSISKAVAPENLDFNSYVPINTLDDLKNVLSDPKLSLNINVDDIELGEVFNAINRACKNSSSVKKYQENELKIQNLLKKISDLKSKTIFILGDTLRLNSSDAINIANRYNASQYIHKDYIMYPHSRQALQKAAELEEDLSKAKKIPQEVLAAIFKESFPSEDIFGLHRKASQKLSDFKTEADALLLELRALVKENNKNNQKHSAEFYDSGDIIEVAKAFSIYNI